MRRDRPLFALRKHRRQVEELEEEGKNLWTDELKETTRIKLVHAVGSLVRDAGYYFDEKMAEVANLVCSQAGLISLSHSYNLRTSSSAEEIGNAILTQRCEEEIVFSILEAIWDIAPYYPDNLQISPRVKYTEEIRTILEDCRISYDFVEGNIVPRGEQEMHVEVVVPAITLLSCRSGLEDAERNYMEALTSIREQRFDDAVTNAASAVEATLRILDCGDTQTPLAKRGAIAIEKNLLAPHDRGLLGWITATRGSEGDAHGQGSHTARADAWLVVHVAGALILRLADGPNRGLGS